MAEMVIHYLQQQRQQLAVTRKRGTLLDFEDGGTDVPLVCASPVRPTCALLTEGVR